MIKHIFNIKHYWKVIIYVNVNYNFFDYIVQDLLAIDINVTIIDDALEKLKNNEAKAFTISNISKKVSIICFNKHKDIYDFVNSIVHESEHIKQAILKAYNILDKDEHPAYLVGYIVMNILKLIKLL